MDNVFIKSVFFWLFFYYINSFFFNGIEFYICFHVLISLFLIYKMSIYLGDKKLYNIYSFIIMVFISFFFISSRISDDSSNYVLFSILYPITVLMSFLLYVSLWRIDIIYTLCYTSIYVMFFVMSFYIPCFLSVNKKNYKKYLPSIFILFLLSTCHIRK